MYLITGGLGGIGYQVASMLARDYHARLASVGRRQLDDALTAKVGYWKQQAHVFYTYQQISPEWKKPSK